MGIVDFDVVDFTNLQRQIIHSTANVGRPKLESAKERIAEINPYVQVDAHETALTSENALELLAAKSVVTLDEERKATMVSNLLVVLCSERGTQPVVNTGTLYQ